MAYYNTRKVGKRKMQKKTDKRDGKTVNPIKVRIIYEGIINKGLVIQFWYNYDLKIIEIA